MRRALLALLLLASPASAATISVSSPSALASANTAAVAGDTVAMAAGSYGAIAPSAIGVSYVGDAANPNAVTVSSVTPRRGLYLRGLKINNNLSLTDAANRIVAEWVTITGIMDFGDADSCRVQYATITGRLSHNGGPSGGTQALADTLMDATFPGIAVTPSSDNGWHVGSTSGPSRVSGAVLKRVNMTMNQSGSNPYAPIKFYNLSASLIEDCTFVVNSTATGMWNGSSRGDLSWSWRDSTAGNMMRRSTFTVNSQQSDPMTGILFQSGTRANLCSNNTFDSVVVKVSYAHDAGHGNLMGVFLLQDKTDGLVVKNSVFACRIGDAFNYSNTFQLNGYRFYHNTFYTGSGQANHTNDLAISPTGSRVAGNLWYTRTTSGCAIHLKSSTDRFGTDSSLVYRGDGLTAQAIGEATCGAASGGYRWGNPQFIDTTWATLNLRPGPGSAASAAWFPGGYAGYYDPSTIVPPSDTQAPAQITDLSGAVLSPTRVILTWTSPGDDGFVGTATSVTVKRAASAISDQTAWDAATTVGTISGGSLSSGGEQQSFSDNTVSASTTYHYAVRGADEVPNTGAISNDLSLTTTAAGDTVVPYPVQDLRATPLTATTVQLSWTATGGDGIFGQAARYRLKYRAGTTFVTADSAAATSYPGVPTPKPANFAESMVVSGLSANTNYAFALWVWDDTGNKSWISNAATARTLSGDSWAVTTATRRRRR